jgi:tetratricopeptide (TPR) repeat protein
MVITTTYSQKQQPNFKIVVDSILAVKPKNYKEIKHFLGSFRKDSTKLKQLIISFKNNNYLNGKTYVENQLGILYRNYSNFEKAIETHKQALKTSKEAESIEFQVFSLNMLGVDYRRLDANRTALDYNQEALALAETVKEPNLGLRRSIAVSHNSMGNIYLLLKQYNLAINQFNKSQQIEKSIDNKLGLAINNQNIGHAKSAQGKTDEALQYYKKSLAINNELNSVLGKIICKSSIANIYIQQQKLNQALQLIEGNIPTVKKMGNDYYLASEYLNLGWVQTKLKLYRKAETNLFKGLNIAKKHNFISSISVGYTHLSELNQQKNNFKKALNYYQLAEEFDEKISNERNAQYVNDLILKYDSEQKNNQIKDLAKQNEISKLQLIRNRNFRVFSLGLISLLAIILYALYKNNTLKNEKKIITLKQNVLQSQMNPHFIFNSLNAIKLYIIDNEKENAVYYLNKFSKLIRKILASARNKENTLAEEIDTLKLYIEIENIRFLNEIETEFNIDEKLNLKTIKVPTLILQPFIENAIWHGLSSKKGKKEIKLTFEKEKDSHLKITIIDNGIGRKKSAAIKKKKIHKKESIGIKLTEERLKSFTKDYKNSFSIRFIDLISDGKKAVGTKIIIKTPLY